MIYFLQDQSTNIKIGYTAGEPKDRLKAMQTGSSSPLVLLGQIEGDREYERELHAQFSGAWLCGEWFRPIPSLVQFVIFKTRAIPAAEQVRLLFLEKHSSHYGDEILIICPVCGFDYTHPGKVDIVPPMPHRIGLDSCDSMTLHFSCENSHNFAVKIEQQEGRNFVTVERLADDPPHESGVE